MLLYFLIEFLAYVLIAMGAAFALGSLTARLSINPWLAAACGLPPVILGALLLAELP